MSVQCGARLHVIDLHGASAWGAMGKDKNDGVIDNCGRLFGYQNFNVADGSIIPANLSVNPSLTILALSEWIMSHVPKKPLDKNDAKEMNV